MMVKSLKQAIQPFHSQASPLTVSKRRMNLYSIMKRSKYYKPLRKFAISKLVKMTMMTAFAMKKKMKEMQKTLMVLRHVTEILKIMFR